MAIRKVDFELEAKLTGPSGGLFSRPSGKLERKSYSDGGERLKIVLRGLKVADDSLARVCANGTEIARLTLCSGSGRYDREGDEVVSREFSEGERIDVTVDGVTLLSGTLQRD